MRQKRKRLCWAEAVKRDFRALPMDVQKELAVGLFVMQLGEAPAALRPCQVQGCERLEDCRGDAVRGVLLRQNDSRVQVLQVFQKTSRLGLEVPLSVHDGVQVSDVLSGPAGTEGVENVLRDLGFEDADEWSAKVSLAQAFNQRVAQCDLGQKAVAAVTGLSPASLLQVRAYRLRYIALDQLIQALSSLGWQAGDACLKPLHRGG